MAARVVFTSGFSRRDTGGAREFTVEAQNLRGVIKEMDRRYPGLGEHLEEETTVAIDGAIHETAYFQPIREGCEIFFIPKLEGIGFAAGNWSGTDNKRSRHDIELSTRTAPIRTVPQRAANARRGLAPRAPQVTARSHPDRRPRGRRAAPSRYARRRRGGTNRRGIRAAGR